MICPACYETASGDGERCPKCHAALRLDGRYRLEEALGHGAFGMTFRARRDDGREVCIKELIASRIESVEALDRFEREGAILRQLHHPRIPRYLDSFRAGADKTFSLYHVMELIEGENLVQEMKHERYVEADVLGILDELCDVLDYLHHLSPPLVHRDLKPSNVMRRTTDRALMLVDFGSVRDTAATTTTMSVAGTFGFMAPEQFYGKSVPASDLYALGVLGVVLLSRRDPAELVDDHQKLAWHKVVQASPATVHLLDGLLQPDLDRRTATAAEARHGVARARKALGADRAPADAGDHPHPAPRPARRSPKAPSARSRRAVARLAVPGASLLGLAWLLWWALSPYHSSGHHHARRSIDASPSAPVAAAPAPPDAAPPDAARPASPHDHVEAALAALADCPARSGRRVQTAARAADLLAGDRRLDDETRRVIAAAVDALEPGDAPVAPTRKRDVSPTDRARAWADLAAAYHRLGDDADAAHAVDQTLTLAHAAEAYLDESKGLVDSLVSVAHAGYADGTERVLAQLLAAARKQLDWQSLSELVAATVKSLPLARTDDALDRPIALLVTTLSRADDIRPDAEIGLGVLAASVGDRRAQKLLRAGEHELASWGDFAWGAGEVALAGLGETLLGHAAKADTLFERAEDLTRRITSPFQRQVIRDEVARSEARAGRASHALELLSTLQTGHDDPTDARFQVRRLYLRSLLAAGRLADARTFVASMGDDAGIGRIELVATLAAAGRLDDAAAEAAAITTDCDRVLAQVHLALGAGGPAPAAAPLDAGTSAAGDAGR